MLSKFLIFVIALIAIGWSFKSSITTTIQLPTKHSESVLDSNIQSKLKYINNIDGSKIAYIELGDLNGHAVIQLHPTPGSLSYGHENEDELARQHSIRLIKFDRPGIGQSTLNSTSQCTCSKQQYNLIMNSIDSIISELNLKSYSLIGHQLGAFYTLLHSKKQLNNNRIENIVLFSPLLPIQKLNNIKNIEFENINSIHKIISIIYNNILGKKTSSKLFKKLWKLISNLLPTRTILLPLLKQFNSQYGNHQNSIINSINQNTMTLFEEFNFYYLYDSDSELKLDNVQIYTNLNSQFEQALQFIQNKISKKQIPNLNPTSTPQQQQEEAATPTTTTITPPKVEEEATTPTTTKVEEEPIKEQVKPTVAAVVEEVVKQVEETSTKQEDTTVPTTPIVADQKQSDNQPSMESSQSTTTITTSEEATPTTPTNPDQSTTPTETTTTTTTTDQSSSSTTTTTTDEKKKIQVAVIGGGLAGLSAAIEIAELGGHVYLIEKEERTGGNSAKATSGINGVLTKAQERLSINDTVELFISDTTKSGKQAGNPNLISTLVKESTSAIEFLENHGIGMELVTQCGGHSMARTHRSAPPKVGRAMNVGAEITFKLLNYIKNNLNDKVTVMTRTRMIGFLTQSNTNNNTQNETIVKGIKYINENDESKEVKELQVDSVVLTTGGYAADREGYLKEYAPQLSKLPTTNGMFANGEGIRMAVKELGASLIHMESIQVHPTGFIDPQNPKSMSVFLAAEALRAYGGIIVNENGDRFCNELGRRDYVSDMIFKNCKSEIQDGHTTAYMIMNDFVAKSFSESLLSFYIGKGFIKKFNNLQHAHQESLQHLNLQNLINSIENYNQFYNQFQLNNSITDNFGKNLFPTSFDVNDIIYVSRITPSIHYTHGGLLFDEKSRVLRKLNNEQVEPIKNLYTAGEASGGLHGLNRLAGNSLLECVVFGRIAASEIMTQSTTSTTQQQQSKL